MFKLETPATVFFLRQTSTRVACRPTLQSSALSLTFTKGRMGSGVWNAESDLGLDEPYGQVIEPQSPH